MRRKSRARGRWWVRHGEWFDLGTHAASSSQKNTDSLISHRRSALLLCETCLLWRGCEAGAYRPRAHNPKKLVRLDLMGCHAALYLQLCRSIDLPLSIVVFGAVPGRHPVLGLSFPAGSHRRESRPHYICAQRGSSPHRNRFDQDIRKRFVRTRSVGND